jgi:hypothetical protein
MLSSAYAVNMITNDTVANKAKAAQIPSEPTDCPSPNGATPTFNGYPTLFDTPNVNGTTCSDMPQLSFFPIDTNANNPRSITKEGGTISLHLSYMNSANPGSAVLANPNLKIYVDQLSATQWKISSSLSSNSGSLTSAQDGGDLIVNVPAGSKLQYVKNTTDNWPNANDRRYQSTCNLISDPTYCKDPGKFPSDPVKDNSFLASNPVFARFTGQQLASDAGFSFKPAGLEAGFLGHGYLLTQLAIVGETNTPPAINGSEITIIRGQGGAFPVTVKPTDKEDTPDKITVTPNNLPSFVTPQTGIKAETQFTVPTTNASTPVRTVFTLTPTDSQGLVGTPGTWIINIIDPGLSLVKSCVIKDTTTPCGTQKPGDKVTYKLNLKNSGQAPLTGVVLVDDYDQTKLQDITNIAPAPTSTDAANGIITWNIGNMAVNAEVNGSFDAVVKTSITAPTTIENIAIATSNETPKKEVKVPFNVIIPNTPPAINGSEITIIRGQGGAFPVTVKPTDKEDTPDKITVTPNNLPSFVTPQTGIKNETIIKIPTTDANTPVRTVITLTPTDSSGLVGTPGTWIINIVDPGVTIIKSCVIKDTTTPCGTQKPGDKVTYIIKSSNSGEIDLTNVVVSDDYDQTKLESIANINPAATNLDEAQGKITWNVGSMKKGEIKEFKFDATVKNNVSNTTIENIAVITSDQTPPKESKVTFNVAAKPLLSIVKTCNATQGTNVACSKAGLKPQGLILYTIVVKNDGNATAKNVKVVDDYDQTKIGKITNINPKGVDTVESGTINWELGDLPAGGSITLTYNAIIKDSVLNNDIINNTATVTGEDLPPASSLTTFPIIIPVIGQITPRTGGLTILTLWASLLTLGGAGYYVYNKRSKYTDSFTPARSSEE